MGAGEQLMPHFDIPLGKIGNLTDVHMHGDWLLGLQRDGFLHAWSLTGESVHSYRLPRDVKWTGACSTAEALHLTGMRDGKAGLWHVDMPEQLSRAAPTPPSKW